jgi:acetoin utilization protein AcuB
LQWAIIEDVQRLVANRGTREDKLMKVARLMSKRLYTIGPDDSVEGAVRQLGERGVRHLLVLERGQLVGILSDRDLKRALEPRKAKRKKLLNVGGLFFLLEPIYVREIMTRDPITIEPGATAQDAAALMVRKKFGALPVVKDGILVGIVTETDLLRYFAESPQH